MDPDLVVDEDIKKRLMDGGMDDLLATHFAHLFIRDPIVIFAEDLKELDLSKTDHFENLQSTNWQHMRFKPPPASSGNNNNNGNGDGDDIGWRVEFRPMEIQITDFENAAFSVFMVLITRAILSFDLNLYIPIPRTTENMETAHARDALHNRKFYFRKDPFSHRLRQQQQNPTAATSRNETPTNGATTPPSGSGSGSASPSPPPHVESEYELMTIADIINGGSSFPGLIPLVETYLDSVNVDVETRCALAKYLDLIRRRADGRLWTNAAWIRDFVARHPDYAHDSVVSEKVEYDLVRAVEEVAAHEAGEDGRGVGSEMLTGKKK